MPGWPPHWSSIALILITLAGPPRLAAAETWTSSRQSRALCAWRGSIWAATGGGLLRIDSATGKITKLTTADGLPETDVTHVSPWGDRLIVVTRRHVMAYNQSGWRALPIIPTADAAHPAQAVVHNDRLYAAAGSALYRLRDPDTLTSASWERLETPQELRFLAAAGDQLSAVASGGLWSLAAGDRWQRLHEAPPDTPVALLHHRGSLVLAARGGVFVRKGQQWRRIPVDTLPGATQLSDAAVHAGLLLIAVHGSGVWAIDPTHPEKPPVRHASGPLGEIRCLLPRARDLWVGTTSGLRRWNGKAWKSVPVANEPPGNTVVALARYEQALWIATQDGGLARFDRGSWEAGVGPERPHVLHLAGEDKRLWARHPDGKVSIREGGRWSQFDPGGGDRLTWITGVWPAGDSVWLGTWAGATRWGATGGRRRRENYVDGAPLTGEPVTAAVEHQGEQWLGTGRKGIAVRASDGQWRAYHEGNGLPDGWITALASDGERVWAGTFNGGIACWDGRAWTNPRPIAGPGGLKITSLAVDPRGGVWAGTRAGLARWQGGKWQVWTAADGLPGDEVLSLLAEEDGIWVGTRTGLTRFILPR